MKTFIALFVGILSVQSFAGTKWLFCTTSSIKNLKSIEITTDDTSMSGEDLLIIETLANDRFLASTILKQDFYNQDLTLQSGFPRYFRHLYFDHSFQSWMIEDKAPEYESVTRVSCKE